MPELRVDPLTGRKALIAADRAQRPNDFQHDLGAVATGGAAQQAWEARRAACPFCAGRESATPIALDVYPAPPQAWQVRVVPNKFPALTLESPQRGDAVGAHEVVIESPRHVRDWTELSSTELAAVLAVHASRLRHWSARSRFAHALIFKNCGPAAGASLEHVHSQLVAVPYVVDAVAVELQGAARLATPADPCWFCAEVRRQQASDERRVVADDSCVAFCPPAPRQPFETWVLPASHQERFEETDADGLEAAARVLHRTLRAIQKLSGCSDYNLVLHTAPFAAAKFPSYHWHWEIVPRVSCLAGLELGGGVYVNSVAPEKAAELLRRELAHRDCEKRP